MDKPYPYKGAKVVQGERINVEFWVWDTSKNELARKRIYDISGKTKREKLKHARKLAMRINKLLKDDHTIGDEEDGTDNHVFSPFGVLAAVKKAVEIKSQGGSKSLVGQLVSLRNRFETWSTQEKIERLPLPQFTRQHAYKFLD